MATFRAPKPYSVVGTVGNARHILQRGYGNGGERSDLPSIDVVTGVSCRAAA